MVEKLNEILKHRYGKGLTIRQLMGISQDTSQEASLRGEDLCIPIFVKEIFLGYGLVHEARGLSFDEQTQVTRLVKMILEPHLYSQHLERSISNIEIEKQEAAKVEAEEAKTVGIFLFGANPSIVQKMAMETHEISQNMMYLPYSDVSAEIKSSADLKAMTSSTLVVDLEKSMSLETQNILADFLKSATSGPLLIFVGSKSAAHLNLENDLKIALASIEFSVDRLPLDKAALTEVLEMLYFKS